MRPLSISAIDPETLQAYRETDYRVLGDLPLTLHVDAVCPELLLLHARYQVRCSAFITACNPLGRSAAAPVNAQHQQALLAQLSRRKLVAIPGIGEHPTNQWPGEPSFLVPGVARRTAQALGRQFEQNAIVWSGLDAVPKLILLR
jgi:Protein of unknown function (DUF3293)